MLQVADGSGYSKESCCTLFYFLGTHVFFFRFLSLKVIFLPPFFFSCCLFARTPYSELQNLVYTCCSGGGLVSLLTCRLLRIVPRIPSNSVPVVGDGEDLPFSGIGTLTSKRSWGFSPPLNIEVHDLKSYSLYCS